MPTEIRVFVICEECKCKITSYGWNYCSICEEELKLSNEAAWILREREEC